MSRFVEDITTTRTAEEVERAVSTFLTAEGFTRTIYKRQEVWKKGHGLMMGPQYIAATPVDGHVRIEAWGKYAILPGFYVGEIGVGGAFGYTVKRKLNQRIEQIEEVLTSPKR